MNPENSRRLQSDFPQLYRSQRLDPLRQDQPTVLALWGFECGDGWMDLIYRLSQAISKRIESTGLDIVATQVKEKFGTLRFYVDGGDEEVFRLIDSAEQESATICEACGAPGTLVTKGWHSTLCECCRRA
ncbi:hypothetical protein IHE49_04845 [Rhodanobacter sp. 7MK24]|uniref:hypothetical protein n=1 Tax=Rhodanobacter sp. 7MK24 TaxID=2775922 RepID=UPI00177CCBB7|nr:hypothetical protein [Rhodanobacter sp. 7MK24]MBD8879799.1 hypothetical protein [Rhodanobacter sp. 7MK24]